MSESVQDDDLLINYLDGILSAGEEAAVETRLKTDAAFRERYQKLQVVLQAVRHMGTIQQVQNLHAEIMQERQQNRQPVRVIRFSRTIRYTMGIAASLLLVFIGVRLYLNAQVSPESIYKETFIDFNVATTRSTDNTLTPVEIAYQKNDYQGALSAPRTLNLSPKDSLLLGLSYLHQENLPEAIRWFHSISGRDNEYRQDAEFYLALTYLKTKDAAAALPYFERIANNNAHLYHQQVSPDVVEKLKNLAK